MSRPTEIMLVASATSTVSASRPKIASSRCFAFATSSVDTREVSSIGSLMAAIRERCVGGVHPPALGAVARGAIAHFVLDDPARAAEFAQRVEVAKRRHVRIGGFRALASAGDIRVVRRLRGSDERRQRPQEDQLRTPSLRGDAQIEPRRIRR